jgi:SAM-dependent methyltransferase
MFNKLVNNNVMCELCDSKFAIREDSRVVFTKNGFAILECNCCHCRYIEIAKSETYVNQVYSDDYFFEGKAGYPNYFDEKDLLINYGKRYASIVSKFIQPGRILDVGSAAGFILRGFELAGWDCYGVEPNGTMSSYARNELKLDVVTSSLEQFKTPNKFDLISMVQVIIHLYDFNQSIENIINMLKPKGLVLIESWDKDNTYAKVMAKHWHVYSPPSTVRFFSDKTLIQLLGRYNLKLIDKGYPDKRIKVKHALSLLKEITPDFPFRNKFINSLNHRAGNLTLRYPFHDLKWYLFQLDFQ